MFPPVKICDRVGITEPTGLHARVLLNFNPAYGVSHHA